MEIGTIQQYGNILKAVSTDIGYQYSSGLKIKVEYKDNYLDGYAMTWHCAYDRNKKPVPLVYDTETMLITLRKECFINDGMIYIGGAAVRGDEIINLRPAEFAISCAVDHSLNDLPEEHGWLQEAEQLFKQIIHNEFELPLNDLMANTAEDLQKLKQDTRTELSGMEQDTTAKVDTLVQNAKTDFNTVKKDTETAVNQLKVQAATQQTQVTNSINQSTMLRDDLIAKRDSGFFDGSDGALVPTGSGFFTLFKSDGHLKIRVVKGSSPPPLIHKNGHLYYRKVKEAS